jgi:hypothetical protein
MDHAGPDLRQDGKRVVVGDLLHPIDNAHRPAVEASLDQKQRLQKLLFPSDVTYSRNAEFGTAETSVLFRLFQALPGGNSEVVTPMGIEPMFSA